MGGARAPPASPSRARRGRRGRRRARTAQWHAAPWLPPAAGRARCAARRARAAPPRAYGLEAIWCVKIETGIDGVAWLELRPREPRRPDDDEEEPTEAEREVVDAIFDEHGGGAVPRARRAGRAAEAGGAEAGRRRGRRRRGRRRSTTTSRSSRSRVTGATARRRSSTRSSFPIERYPEIIDDYDWESFGIAFKLAGPALPGEESVINAFFALWLSVYQDERVDEFEPFQRADVIHDRKHRSALMWVERFAVPATASDQVHFLLWIVARIHDILPIAWARFDTVDDAVKSHADGGDGREPFVLAGNPFAERFRRHGEEAALAWAVVAERVEPARARRACSSRSRSSTIPTIRRPRWSPSGCCAARCRSTPAPTRPATWRSCWSASAGSPRRSRSRATAPSRDVRLLVVGETAEHAPGELDAGARAARRRDARARPIPRSSRELDGVGRAPRAGVPRRAPRAAARRRRARAVPLQRELLGRAPAGARDPAPRARAAARRRAMPARRARRS